MQRIAASLLNLHSISWSYHYYASAYAVCRPAVVLRRGEMTMSALKGPRVYRRQTRFHR